MREEEASVVSWDLQYMGADLITIVFKRGSRRVLWWTKSVKNDPLTTKSSNHYASAAHCSGAHVDTEYTKHLSGVLESFLWYALAVVDNQDTGHPPK